MKEVIVSAGIIINKDKILCLQRGCNKYDYISYKFEFPGGKLEADEDGKEALRRELIEEMEIEISLDNMEHFLTVEHEYPDFKVILHSYICPSENPEFKLLEHIDFKWLKTQELMELDWAAADLPVVDALIRMKG